MGKQRSFLASNASNLAAAEHVRAVGEGLSEMKIDFAPGYRVYYMQTGQTIVLILCGGDKSKRDKDIKRAKQIAAEL